MYTYPYPRIRTLKKQTTITTTYRRMPKIRNRVGIIILKYYDLQITFSFNDLYFVIILLNWNSAPSYATASAANFQLDYSDVDFAASDVTFVWNVVFYVYNSNWQRYDKLWTYGLYQKIQRLLLGR